MSRLLKVACLQTQAYAEAADALQHALQLAQDAVNQGATFLLLPEYSGGLKTSGRSFAPPVFSEFEHPVVNGLCNFAAQKNVWIVLGSVAITGDDGLFYNRTFLIDDCGNIQCRYNKLHLFDIHLSNTQSYLESATVKPGNQAILLKTPFAVIGLSICYDLRFPQLYRDLAQAGAEILLVPAAFTKKTGEAHWHILNRARAIENGAFVIAPCATGSIDGGGESYGHSLVVDPWGEVLADGGELPGIVTAQIDLDVVAQTRSRIPSLEHDKPYQVETINLEFTT